MNTDTNRKRTRDEVVGDRSACLGGQAPQFSQESGTGKKSDMKFGTGKETNEHRIEARLKQIQFGKNTIGYDNYLAAVPKEKRARLQVHPRTPDPYEETSKRQFDGRVKAWRRELHKWDVLDDIARVPVPLQGKHQGQQQGLGAGGAQNASSSSSSNGKEGAQVQVLAPVLAPNGRPRTAATSKGGNSNHNNNSSSNTSSSGAAGAAWGGSELDYKSAYRYGYREEEQLDSPAGKRARTSAGAVGEDVEALEGVDYDCEAPDDGDEDVL